MPYHINDKGEPGLCKAQKNCPFGGIDVHYATPSAAREAYEKNNDSWSRIKNFFPQKHTVWDEEKNIARTKELVAEYESLEEKLERDFVASIGYYTFCGYKEMNYILRQREDKIAAIAPNDLPLIRKHAQRLALLTKAYPEAKEPRVLYRYRKVPSGMTPEKFVEDFYKTGATIEDTGITSTTEDLGLALAQMSYQKKENYVVLAIATKKGLPLQRDEERVGNIQSFEKERILPPETKMKVVNAARKRISVPKDREKLAREFNGGWHNYYRPIPGRDCLIIEMVDEDLLKR